MSEPKPDLICPRCLRATNKPRHTLKIDDDPEAPGFPVCDSCGVVGGIAPMTLKQATEHAKLLNSWVRATKAAKAKKDRK